MSTLHPFSIEDEMLGIRYVIRPTRKQRERLAGFLQHARTQPDPEPASGWYLFLPVLVDVQSDQGEEPFTVEGYLYVMARHYNDHADLVLVHALLVLEYEGFDRLFELPETMIWEMQKTQ